MIARSPHSRGTFFCDTSVLVAAAVRAHPHRDPSVHLLERARRGVAFCAAHSLAEMYATLTALPLRPRVHSADALAAVRHRAGTLTAIPLTTDEMLASLAQAAARHAVSGQIYDALILAAAEKSNAETIYTWNVAHFERIAAPSLLPRLRTPPPPEP